MSDYEPGDLVKFEDEDALATNGIFGFIESVARDGDLHLKFDGRTIRDEDVTELVERTGDPELDRSAVIDLLEEHFRT